MQDFSAISVVLEESMKETPGIGSRVVVCCKYDNLQILFFHFHQTIIYFIHRRGFVTKGF